MAFCQCNNDQEICANDRKRRRTIARNFPCRVSYLEIYNEAMFDLLATFPDSVSSDSEGIGGLQVIEDEQGVYVRGLSSHLAQTEEEALNLLFEVRTQLERKLACAVQIQCIATVSKSSVEKIRARQWLDLFHQLISKRENNSQDMFTLFHFRERPTELLQSTHWTNILPDLTAYLPFTLKWVLFNHEWTENCILFFHCSLHAILGKMEFFFFQSRSRVQSEAKYTTSKLNFVDLAGSERLSKTKVKWISFEVSCEKIFLLALLAIDTESRQRIGAALHRFVHIIGNCSMCKRKRFLDVVSKETRFGCWIYVWDIFTGQTRVLLGFQGSNCACACYLNEQSVWGLFPEWRANPTGGNVHQQVAVLPAADCDGARQQEARVHPVQANETDPLSQGLHRRQLQHTPHSQRVGWGWTDRRNGEIFLLAFSLQFGSADWNEILFPNFRRFATIERKKGVSLFDIFQVGVQCVFQISTLRFAARMMCVSSEATVNEFYDPEVSFHLSYIVYILSP